MTPDPWDELAAYLEQSIAEWRTSEMDRLGEGLVTLSEFARVRADVLEEVQRKMDCLRMDDRSAA